MSHRILVAGLYHETNSFSSEPTTREHFLIARGDEIFTMKGDGSPMAAFLEFSEKQGWEVLPTIDYRAIPSGMIEDDIFEQFLKEFDASVTALNGEPDAVFLILHGAMMFRNHPDPEGELAEIVRRRFPNLPVFGAYDLHANATGEMCKATNGLVAYRKNPHTDAAETATRASELLARCLESGELPRTDFCKPPILWPALGVASADRPMKTLLELAAKFETDHPEIWAININAGFPYMDIPVAGLSFSMITTGSEKLSRHVFDTLTKAAWEERHLGIPQQSSVAEALQAALILPKNKGPVILVEPADNVGGGGDGDNTAVLRQLLATGTRGGGVVLYDPNAVATLREFSIGDVLDIEVGGRHSPLDPEPAKLIGAKLIHRSEGKFELEDIHSHLASIIGKHVDMGPCVTLECAGNFILLTTRRMPPWDLGQWRSQGIDPETLRVIGVKAAAAHRRAYDKIAQASIAVDYPGACTTNLHNLTFKHLRRPVFPLDDLSDDEGMDYEFVKGAA